MILKSKRIDYKIVSYFCQLQILKNLQIKNKEMEDQFQILVSTADYLKLQSKYQDAETQNNRLTKQKDELNLLLMQLSSTNAQMQKKITKLEDNIVFLSKQGLKMAQNLLNNLRTGLQTQQKIKAQTQKQLLVKNKQMEKELKSYEQKIEQLNKIIKQKKQQLEEKQKLILDNRQQFVERLQILEKKSQQQSQKYKKIFQMNQNLISQNKKQSATINRMKQQLNMLNSRCIQWANSADQYKQQFKSGQLRYDNLITQHNYLTQQFNKLSNQMIQRQKQLQSKNANMQKIMYQYLQKTKFLDKNIHNSKNQNEKLQVHIKILQKQLAEAQEQLKGRDEQIKFYEQIQLNLKKQSSQQKAHKQSKQKERALTQIKKMIQQYFLQMILNLIQIGDIQPELIKTILQQQEQAVVSYIRDSVITLTSSKINYNKIKPEPNCGQNRNKC